MAITKVTIWNFALHDIGSTRTVAEGDGSREAQSCALFWDAVLDGVTQEADWYFLSAYKVLTAPAESPNNDWMYGYALPSYCAKVRRVVRATMGKTDPNPPPFTLGLTVAGDGTATRVLFTDEPPDIEIEYTYKGVSIPYDAYPLFSLTLGWALAKELAPGLAKINGASKLAAQQYDIALQRALLVNEQQRVLNQPESEFIRARD